MTCKLKVGEYEMYMFTKLQKHGKLNLNHIDFKLMGEVNKWKAFAAFVALKENGFPVDIITYNKVRLVNGKE